MTFNLKSALVFLTGIVLLSGILLLSKAGTAQNEVSVPIAVDQMIPVDDKVPVEIQCNNAELGSPNKLERLPCILLNNTDKEIVAFSIRFRILSVVGAQPREFTGNISDDLLMHPDLYEKRKSSFIRPQGRTPVTLLPTTLDTDFKITGVSIGVSYVEFHDGSSIGKGSYAANLLSQFRQGFEIYRNWFTPKYKEEIRSKTRPVLDLLKSLQERSVGELGGLTPNQKEGAKIFQKFIRQSYLSEGERGISDVIK